VTPGPSPSRKGALKRTSKRPIALAVAAVLLAAGYYFAGPKGNPFASFQEVPAPAHAQPDSTPPPPGDLPRKNLPVAQQIAADDDEMSRAIEAVKAIVNQPARQVPITGSMNVEQWSDIWFHPGALVPNYAKTDVTKSQELNYSQYEYVTSTLHPGIAFVGSELEFNSMTKYFYTDRTVPKKRLTQAEMLEINRLYRVIAWCQEDLSRLRDQ
jgi:hypothetical protein